MKQQADIFEQDLKDFARLEGLDVVYSEIGRGRDGTGWALSTTASITPILTNVSASSSMRLRTT
jgi:hypothetical protein